MSRCVQAGGRTIVNETAGGEMEGMADMTGIRVVNGGMLTTVQDRGRYGYQASGMQVSGVMDMPSALLANALVGNEELSGEAAVLETTYLGPELEFRQDALAAVAGGMPDVLLDGVPVRPYSAIDVKAGQRLRVAAQKSGIRAYIAVSGGFATAKALGSRATNLKLGLGGYMGRKLEAGDILPVGTPGGYAAKALSGRAGLRKVPESYVDTLVNRGVAAGADGGKIRQIRVIPGPQEDYFSQSSIDGFAASVYTVSNDSDRMGYRLQGLAIEKSRQQDLITDGIAFGSIQIPPDGQPIVMLADHQTTGGYPKLATVATVDLPLMAQSMPGDSLQFRIISVQEAQGLLRQQHGELAEVIRQMKEQSAMAGNARQMKGQAVMPVSAAGGRQFRLKIDGEVFDVIIRQE
ncbi:biotin-dependent carboxyltransferase family protein [Anaerovibrio sp.]|uniref:5-oxoprolinase subunit C family protein n=1 Tax=Anaerovibrio sp. TaxID=1872532 RepID=UPI003F139676